MPIQNGKYVAPTWVNNASPPINASELQAMCDTIAGNQGVFLAVYGTTTYDEIETAYNNGKTVLCAYLNGSIYALLTLTAAPDGQTAYFSGIQSANQTRTAQCDKTSGWAGGGFTTLVTSSQITYMAKIEAGSYTGTGTYGSSNLNSLTFSFVPKFVIIIEDYTASGTYQITNGLFVNPGRSGVYQYTSTGAGAALRLTWSGTTLSWYGTSALIQLNTNNRNYVYVAIG